jgi:hypothetical protein
MQLQNLKYMSITARNVRKQDRQCTYNVILGCVCITIFQWKHKSVCVAVELHITINYIKILSVSQQYIYGKFVSPAMMQILISSL